MNESILCVGLDYHRNSVRVCAVNHKAEIIADRDVNGNWFAVRSADIRMAGALPKAEQALRTTASKRREHNLHRHGEPDASLPGTGEKKAA